MLTLRQLKESDESDFIDIINEFNLSDPNFLFEYFYSPDISFKDYVKMTNNRSKGIGLKEGLVPESFLLAVVDEQIVGRVSIRHTLNDFLRTINGHIGYGVRPKCRKQGYAKEILKQSLDFCKSLKIEKVMLTCDDDNLGSIKTIEANQGKLAEKFLFGEPPSLKRRYWIEI
jgi:predicted acetyltransferase